MTARRLLTVADWRAVAASPAPALLGLWAEDDRVHALLSDRDAATPLLASVAVEGGAYPALSPAHPGAGWFERMIRDLWGHHAEGGIDARPWLDHGEWPVAAPMAPHPGPGEPAEFPDFLPVAEAGLHLVSIGPVRGGISPAAHLRLACRGERVLRAEARLGYTHKGVLALLRGKPPRAAARFVSRLAAEATVAHAAAFARATEAALETPAPPRAASLRDVMGALERAANHLATLGAIAGAAGAAALTGRCDRERETLLAAAEAAFGHRLMMDLVVPGGVSADLASGGHAAIPEAAATLQKVAPELRRRFETTAGLGDRITGAGIVGQEAVARFAASDALAGDVAARVRARLLALETDGRALAAALATLPEGPISTALPVGSGEGIGAAESAGGTVWHWLRLEGGLIAACFPLDPGWRAWPITEAALAGSALADVELIVRSIGAGVSGVDL